MQKQTQAKLNCWQVMECGREPSGNYLDERGPCPAATMERFDGINGGLNGGRVCWAINDTICDCSGTNGSFAAKYLKCRQCDFYKRVAAEEGPRAFVLTPIQIRRVSQKVGPNHGSTANGSGQLDHALDPPGAAIELIHRREGLVNDAYGMLDMMRKAVIRNSGHTLGVLHDASALQAAGQDYRDVFVAAEHELGDKIGMIVAVFPDAMMRVMARTIHKLTGRYWLFFASRYEAKRALLDAGYQFGPDA